MSVTVSHRLPGRIRLEIAGMRHQPILAYKMEQALSGIAGILEINCSPSTGRALIRLQENLISAEQVIERIERALSTSTHTYEAQSTVAATSEAEAPPSSSLLRGLQQLLPRQFQPIQQTEAPQHTSLHMTHNPYRLPMLASVSSLGVLGIKRLLIGRSALAIAPVPFYLAAAGSIIAGYPALRRATERPLHQKGVNPDLVLGAVALGFAVLRENLLALSAITILNIAMYRRHRVVQTPEATHLPPEMERYSRNMTRAGFLLSPLTWLLTGSPLRALGVLLAANPRPATLAHKYAWTQAEREASERQLPLPRHGYLESLAHAQTIVFATHTELSEDSRELLIQPIRPDIEQDKVVRLTSSLLEKMEQHPLRAPLLEIAQKDARTHRTAFDVEQTDEGVSGTINGLETMIGSKSFCKERNIDLTSVLLAERRM
ncbi:MAG: HMA2 domain-containing protein, partial [Tumebacillaceae bacterium]